MVPSFVPAPLLITTCASSTSSIRVNHFILAISVPVSISSARFSLSAMLFTGQ